MFADDTCLTYVHENLQILESHVNSRLAKILDWCRFNKLALNPTKSEFMLVTTKPVPIQPRLLLGSDEISNKDSARYLGLTLDKNLKFASHVENVSSKLAQFIGIAQKLNAMMNLTAAKNYYYSCTYSTLIYCITVWGGAITASYRGKKLVERHERLVNKIFGKFYLTNSSIFKAARLLNLDEIYKFHVCVQMFKALKLNKNPVVASSIECNFPEHNYATRNRDRMIVPFPRIGAIKMNFKFTFVSIWNSIDSDIRESRTLRIFKKNLFAYLISKY